MRFTLTNCARRSMRLSTTCLRTSSRALSFEHPHRLDVDYESGGTSIWVYARQLLEDYKCVNHGQGFPNWQCPEFVKQAAKDSIDADHNQYAPAPGHPLLVAQLIKEYSEALKHELVPANVQPTAGAMGGVYNCCQAFLHPGDEAITFEPYFDNYKVHIGHTGATMKTVPVILDRKSKTWSFDPTVLESQITDKTKILLLNSPHNPTGMVFSKEQLQTIVDILKKHPQIIVISDEVYENIVFGDAKHLHIASFEGMFERTVTVNSAGKKFSVTGWKVGWAIGPKQLIEAVNFVTRAQMWCASAPMQAAVAFCFQRAAEPYEGHPDYYQWLQAMYSRKRDDVMQLTKAGGFDAVPSDGTFFVTAESSKIAERLLELGLVKPPNADSRNPLENIDWQVAKWVAENARVTCLPMSAFTTKTYPEPWRMMRFTFCVKDESFEISKKRICVVKELLSL